MKICSILPLVIVIELCLGFACVPKERSRPSVRILTYSSLAAKSGFLESVRAEFEKKSDCELRVQSTLGAVQMLSYLEEPKQQASLDLVYGIDEVVYERASTYLDHSDRSALLKTVGLENIIEEQMKKRPGFLPVDFAYLSFLYRKADFSGAHPAPTQISDLTLKAFEKKWIVQDPRASSPGLLFFLFSDQIVKLSDLKSKWLTLAPSWSASYKMFLAHEAPLVWTYLSSLAYHAKNGEGDLYDFVRFKEGYPLQIEGMALLNRSGNALNGNACVLKWVQFIYEKTTQEKIAEMQWMMPVKAGVTLPPSFSILPKQLKAASIDPSAIQLETFMNQFAKEVNRGSP